MLMAQRSGRYYQLGDEGFEEAWDANMKDVVNEATRKFAEMHAMRMRSDPKYRAKQEALEAEYDRAFNAT